MYQRDHLYVTKTRLGDKLAITTTIVVKILDIYFCDYFFIYCLFNFTKGTLSATKTLITHEEMLIDINNRKTFENNSSTKERQ